MRFRTDDQRKAVFANMFKGSSSNSKVSSSNVTNFETKSPKKRLRKGLKTYGKAQSMRIGMQTLSQAVPPPTQFSYAPLSESKRRKSSKTIVLPKGQCHFHARSSGAPKSKRPCPDCRKAAIINKAPISPKKKRLLQMHTKQLNLMTKENRLRKELERIQEKGEDLIEKHADDPQVGYLSVAKNVRLETEVSSKLKGVRKERQEISDMIRQEITRRVK